MTVIKKDYFNTEHLNSGLKDKALRSAGVTIFTNTLSFVIHMFSTVILARLLTPNDYGLVTMVVAFSALLQNYGENCFMEAIIQSTNLNNSMMSTFFWVNVFITAVLTLLFMLLAPVLVWFYSEPLLFAITVALSFSILAGGMYTMHISLLARNMQFYLTSGISMLALIVSLLITIFLAWRGFGYWALIANIIMQPVIIAICAWLACGWRPGKPGPLKDILPLLKFSLHAFSNYTLNYFSRNIDKMLAGWRFGAESLGHYKRAYDLFTLPANQLVAPINNVALATLCRLTNEPDKYRYFYLRAISIIAFIGMPISALLTLCGNDIILLILGPQWIKAGEIFCYFGTSIGIMLISYTKGWLHLSLGRPDRWFRWSIFETAVTICCFVVSLQFGITAVAIVYSLSFYILVIPCLWYAGKPVELPIYSIISMIWRYFVAALIAGLLSFAVLHKINCISAVFINLNAFMRILAASFLCSLIYLILVIIFYQSLNPLKNFIRTAHQMLPTKTILNQK